MSSRTLTKRLATLPVVLATTLLVTINTAIVNVALTSIRVDLGFSATTISWVINAYLLAYGGLLIAGGRLGDVIGRRRAMLTGVVLFTVASAVAGLAWNPALLIAGRATQGLGAALAAPAVLAIITNLYEGPARGKALGWFSVVLGAGLSLGLIAGGVILQWLQWRWVFWINVPAGATVFGLSLRFVPSMRASEKRHLDLIGAILATLTTLGVVLAVVELAGTHRLGAVMLISVALAVLAFIALYARLRSASDPLIPLSLFSRRSTIGGLLAFGLLSGAATPLIFFMSQLFSTGLGLAPIGVGALFLVFTGPQLASALSASRLMHRIGTRPILAAGLVVAALGFTLLALAVRSTDVTPLLIIAMVLAGTGVGVVYLGVNTIILASVPPEIAGAASGMIQTAGQVGGSTGIAVLILVQSLTDVTGALLGAAAFIVLALAATFLRDRPTPAAQAAPTPVLSREYRPSMNVARSS